MSRPTPPLNIMIVEDEMLIAMDIGAMVEDAGHVIVAEAASVHDIHDMNDMKLDVAFVDIHLANGTSGLDASAVIQRRWASALIIFLTANPAEIPDDFAGAHGVIGKPFSRTGLMSAIRYLEEGVCDPPPVSRQPQSFVAAPGLAANWSA